MKPAYSYRSDPEVPPFDDSRPLFVFDALRLIPRPLRDAAYRLIARNRYRWFGKAEACALLTPEQRQRLL